MNAKSILNKFLNLFSLSLLELYLFAALVCALVCFSLPCQKSLCTRTTALESLYSPKGAARVNHPVAGSFLSYSFLDQRLFAAKQLHGQPVVGGLEPCLQLIFEKVR
jgi:hypothetical protein